jgi:hypothetical protein
MVLVEDYLCSFGIVCDGRGIGLSMLAFVFGCRCGGGVGITVCLEQWVRVFLFMSDD